MDFMSLRSQNCSGHKDASSIAICVSAYSALCSSKPQNVCCDRVAGVMVTGVDAAPACLGLKILASIRFYVLYCYESN